MIKSAEHPCSGSFFAFRLHPHEDLKKAILQFARDNDIQAGAIVTCVGSLEKIELRFADQTEAFSEAGRFEILSLSGTFSQTSAHLHLSVADKHGAVVGGHLLTNNLVYTTAELLVIKLSDIEFARETDPSYGFAELVVKRLNR